MNVADNIARWLDDKGIHTVFGIIGGGNVAIFDAIARLGETEIVCLHHEQAVVMAAGGFYKSSERVSVALVTTGAGSTNAITGLASAFMDSTPLIVLSGNEASKYMYAPTRVWGVQGYDSSGAVRGLCKSSWRADRHLYLDAALDDALKPRMGPVWVDIPKDVQNEPV